MKLHTRDSAQAEQLREAFRKREPFILTGGGVVARYVASEMSTDFDPGPLFSLSLQQVTSPVVAAEWDGEGLPPVGIDCEWLWSSTIGEYVAVRVVGHDEDRAVVRFISSDRKGEYDSDRQHNDYGYPIFRPMRTPEQIAAEERKVAIDEMLALDNYPKGALAGGLMSRRAFCEALYDAGYRK